jgi:hypothetical protein
MGIRWKNAQLKHSMETMGSHAELTYVRIEGHIHDWRVNMSYHSPELPTNFEAQTYRLDELRRQGRVRTQLHQAGIVRQGWLARQGHQLLHQVGHLLVAIGERLEQDAIRTPSLWGESQGEIAGTANRL